MRDIAAVVKARRTALGLTAAGVAERTEVGKPLTRAVISDLETGRKKTLDVTELVTLAAALELPPTALLFPDISAEIEVLPGKPTDGLTALGWFVGAGGKLGMVEDYVYAPDGIETDSCMHIPLELLRIGYAIADQQFQLARAENATERTTNDKLREKFEQQAESIRDTIELLLADRDVQEATYRGRKRKSDG